MSIANSVQSFLKSMIAATVVVAATSLPAAAQEAPNGASLKTGDAVMDAYVKALGGVEKMEAQKSRKVTGNFAMPAVGLNATMIIMQQAPNKFRLEITIPGVGPMVQIVDGNAAYSKDPFQGERLLSEEEKKATMLEASMNGEAKWRDIYESAKLVGSEDVDGKPAYKVELTSKSGLKRTCYFDQASNLMVKLDTVQSTPQGEIPVSSRLSDYKEVNGVKYPHSTVQTVAGQQIQMTITKIEADVDFPKDTFEIPKLEN